MLVEPAPADEGEASVPPLPGAKAARLGDTLAALLKHGVAIIPTAPERTRNRDAHFPYRFDSYFYYLTGFGEPDAVLVVVAGLIWGADGAASGAFAVALVLGNLALSAVLLSRAARISLALLMAAALGGFALRLFLLTAIVWAVKDQPWVDITALGFTLIVTHLGLLIWETRHVSASLAYPGLKPTPNKLPGGRR